MMIQSKALVLATYPYQERSLIAHLYTAHSGMLHLLVRGARSQGKSATGKMALLQPLQQVDICARLQPGRDLHLLTEISLAHPAHAPHDVRKAAIKLFLAELLHKTLREELQPNEYLFAFLESALRLLDTLPQGYANFHLQLLLKLPTYQGWGLQDTASLWKECGMLPPDAPRMLSAIDRLWQESFLADIPLNKMQRQEILQHLLRYYRQHFPSVAQLKSIEVLQELF